LNFSRKFAEILASQAAPPVPSTPVDVTGGKFTSNTASVIDTGSKFATGVNDAGCK
jgi:hypothetical protein